MRILTFHCRDLAMLDHTRSNRPADPDPDAPRDDRGGSSLGAWVCVEPHDGLSDVQRAATHLQLCRQEVAEANTTTWIIPFVHLSREVEQNLGTAKQILADLASAVGPGTRQASFGFHKEFRARYLRFVWPHVYRGAPVLDTRGSCSEPAIDMLHLRGSLDGTLRLLLIPWLSGSPSLSQSIELINRSVDQVLGYAEQFLPRRTPIEVQWFDHSTLELAHAIAVRLKARTACAPVAHGNACCNGVAPWISFRISPTVGAAVFRRASLQDPAAAASRERGPSHEKLLIHH